MDLKPCISLIEERIPFFPELAIVLGSGLGQLANCPEAARGLSLQFRHIPGFPDQSVQGHAGKMIFCEFEGKNVVFQAGRFHFYEGHSMPLVTAPMRIYSRLGAKAVLLTNAAGALDPTLSVGSLMVIKDQINFQGTNPLIGPNVEPGPRFPDMTSLYSAELRRQLLQAGKRCGQMLSEGVYVATSGPSFETPAEVRAFRLLGGDAVGMSTAPEAIVARQEGMLVAGVSCICNMGAGILDKPLNHSDVLDASDSVSAAFEKVLREFVSGFEAEKQ